MPNQNAGFFAFPIEIRDEIYELLLGSINGTLENGLRFEARNVPIQSILIHGQFHREYVARSQKLSLLTLWDAVTFKVDRSSVFFPKVACAIRYLHFHAFCAPPFIVLGHHLNWLRSLVANVLVRHDADADAIK